MKKILILSCAIMGFLMTSAQNENEHDGKRKGSEKLKALRTAYITGEIDLTSDEAQKFWPIYNAISQKERKAEHEKRKLIKTIEQSYDDLTEQQAEDYLKELQQIEKRIADTHFSQEHEKLIKIIGAKRFFKLQKAEMDFRRKMLRKYKDRKKRKYGSLEDREERRKELRSEYEQRRDQIEEDRNNRKEELRLQYAERRAKLEEEREERKAEGKQ